MHIVNVRKRDGRIEKFVETKIVAGVKKAGATAKEAVQVTKEVAAKVALRAEVTAEELSNMVVTSRALKIYLFKNRMLYCCFSVFPATSSDS